MKTVPVQEAVGMVLGHDVTRIVPGEFKGRAFKKGHIIRPEDIEELLKIGKEHVYVVELQDGVLHENEAAQRIAKAAAGQGLDLTEPVEGKINLVANRNGLLKVNAEALYEINSKEGMVFATLHTNQAVAAGQAVGGTRIVPLAIEESRVHEVEAICRDHSPLTEIKSFRPFRVGLVTTGNEVFHGRIQDRFGSVIRAKFSELGSSVLRQIFVPDSVSLTAGAIRELLEQGADMIAVTGGMSVDPDDQTPGGIRATGAEVVTYGSPVLPGAMFMLAYLGAVPVVGLPGCVMYHKTSIFDLIIPRLLAGERVRREEIVALGHGGFCCNCHECRYPICPFGKG